MKTQTLNLVDLLSVCMELKVYVCAYKHMWRCLLIYLDILNENIAIRLCHEFMEHTFFFFLFIEKNLSTTKSRRILPCVDYLWQVSVFSYTVVGFFRNTACEKRVIFKAAHLNKFSSKL